MFLLYNFLLTLLSPLWVPWMWWRSRKRSEDVKWSERQGNYSNSLPSGKDTRRIWFHAVSVGEVVAALPILKEIKALDSTVEIVLSVTTSSGHKTAREKAAGLYDHLVYFPIDVPRFTLSAMQRVRPKVVAVMETELWFNFLWAAEAFDAKRLLINGRISDRSFPRSRKLKFFYKSLLKMVNRCLMQTQGDRVRIEALGAQTAEVFGNCKFDQAAGAATADPAYWRTELGLSGPLPVLVVGSARVEEFDLLAPSIAGLLEDAQIVIAPRHLEATDDLIAALSKAGVSAKRRSKGERIEPEQVLILDTYGELDQVYSVAGVAVVGGGFANLGGQNILQPLAFGIPVVTGKYMQNFRDVFAAAVEAGALMWTEPNQLESIVSALLNDPEQRAEMGEAAKRLVDQNVGASRRYAQAIVDALG